MAITIHASQAQIATANAPQAAQYRGAEAFVNQGAMALGQGLAQLGRGIGQVGGVLNEKAQEQLEHDMIGEIQDVMRQESAWRPEYQTANTGQGARNAAQDYETFYNELTGPIIAKYQNNPKAHRYMQERLGTIGLSGMNAMRGYSIEQENKYLDSLVEQQRSLLADMSNNPDSSPAERQQSMNEYLILRQQQLVRQGWDAEAAKVQAQGDIKKLDQDAAMNSLASIRARDPEKSLEMVNSALKGEAYAPQGLAPETAQMALTEAETQGLDSSLVLAVMMQESGGKIDAVSSAGARGLMQLMPDTQKELEKKYGIDGSTPEGNVALGTRYLKELLTKYDGDEKLALMAYNWGMGNVDAWIKTGKGKDGQDVPEETRKYVPSVQGKADSYSGIGSDAKILRETLNPQQLANEQRKSEAEITRRQSEANKEAQTLLRGMQDQKTYAVETGDLSGLKEMEAKLFALRNHEAAAELNEFLTVYEMAMPFLQDIPAMPFAEQEARIRAIFSDPAVYRKDNAATVAQVRDMALGAMHKRYAAFAQDPAGEVARMTAPPEDMATVPQSPEQQARSNMAEQKSMAMGNPMFQPKPFSADQANALKQTLVDDNVHINDKIQALVGLNLNYGELTPQILRQIGAPAGVYAATMLAMDNNLDNHGASRMLLAAALMKDSDVPNSGLSNAEVTSALSENEYMKYMQALMLNFPYMTEIPEFYSDLEKAASRMIKINGKGSIKGISKPYDFVVSENSRLFLRIPKQLGLDESAVSFGLSHIRENIGDHLEGLEKLELESLVRQGAWRSDGSKAKLVGANGTVYLTVPLEAAVQQYNQFGPETNFWQAYGQSPAL